jgi:hypothetical protein
MVHGEHAIMPRAIAGVPRLRSKLVGARISMIIINSITT